MFFTEIFLFIKSIEPIPGASQVEPVVRNPTAKAGDEGWHLGQEVPLEEEMATHSSVLAWEIPRTGEPGGLQSMGSQGVRHIGAT